MGNSHWHHILSILAVVLRLISTSEPISSFAPQNINELEAIRCIIESIEGALVNLTALLTCESLQGVDVFGFG